MSDSVARFSVRCFIVIQICFYYPERSPVYWSFNGPVTFGKKVKLVFFSGGWISQQHPTFWRNGVWFQRNSVFFYPSHLQPLSPVVFFGFIFVLYLNPVSRCCCCIGCIPTSFILRSSPHTHPSLLFSPRCHLPSILNIVPRERPPTTDGRFRICPVVTRTADITDWGFVCESISAVLSRGKRDPLIKCNIPEGLVFPVVTPTWNWCLLITIITLPLVYTHTSSLPFALLL